jgi:hypothetical protein
MDETKMRRYLADGVLAIRKRRPQIALRYAVIEAIYGQPYELLHFKFTASLAKKLKRAANLRKTRMWARRRVANSAAEIGRFMEDPDTAFMIRKPKNVKPRHRLSDAGLALFMGYREYDVADFMDFAVKEQLTAAMNTYDRGNLGMICIDLWWTGAHMGGRPYSTSRPGSHRTTFAYVAPNFMFHSDYVTGLHYARNVLGYKYYNRIDQFFNNIIQSLTTFIETESENRPIYSITITVTNTRPKLPDDPYYEVGEVDTTSSIRHSGFWYRPITSIYPLAILLLTFKDWANRAS